MTSAEAAHLSTIRTYLNALEAGTVGEALARFFTPDAVQVELPTTLNPRGGRSDLPTLLTRAEQGRTLLRTQSYVVLSEVAQANRAAVEAAWTGILASPMGPLESGSSIRAHFAMFFEFRGGLISSQRNYDCFEPW